MDEKIGKIETHWHKRLIGIVFCLLWQKKQWKNYCKISFL